MVLGFKGCLNARKDRAISRFVTDSSRIMSDSSQTGNQFFRLLSAPSTRPPLEFETTVKSLRSAAETSYERMSNLDAPGDVSQAKQSMLIALDMRRNALSVIADNIGPALGKEDASDAQQTIGEQMLPLISSDGVFTSATIPELSEAVGDSSVATQLKSIPTFVGPDPAQWLDETKLTDVFTAINPESTEPASGIHGLAIESASIEDTELVDGGSATVSSASPVLTLGVQNGGDSEEKDIEVTVTFGTNQTSKTIESIDAGDTGEINIPLLPAPASGELTNIQVDVDAVPGETLTDNNSATYSVTFE